MAKLCGTSEVMARADVASCALGGGSALLDLNSGTYYTLNPVAAHIWMAMERPTTVAAIVASVAAGFDTAGADCAADVQGLLDRLVELGLVEVVCAEVV